MGSKSRQKASIFNFVCDGDRDIQFLVVLSYNVANVDNLAEIQEPTYRDWSNDLSGSNYSVQWSDRQLLRDSSLLSGVLLTKKSLAMTSEHVEMQLILER